MSFNAWIGAVGVLLLTMALSSAWIRRGPISTAALYLGVGCLIGPWGLNLIHLEIGSSVNTRAFERVTEMAVVLSLFVGGLRLRLPPEHLRWRPAYRLASAAMILTIAGIALVGWSLFSLPPATALLVGAMLAPTDPVLAGEVTVSHSQDQDRLRFALSGEAGLNDGLAFPFVYLALALLAIPPQPHGILSWALVHIVWGIPAGLLIGYILGRAIGKAAIALRARSRDTAAPTDFLALALMALSYAVAQSVGALGFLAVFAAGIGLRGSERRTVEETPHPSMQDTPVEQHPPAEALVAPGGVAEHELDQPAVAAGVLVAEVFTFGDIIERMLEVLLVVLVGVSLATYLTFNGVVLGLLVLLVIRPLSVYLSLLGSEATRVQRALIGWFGIRGIGSLYYLAFAAKRLTGGAESRLGALVLSTVAVSVVVHGLTAQSLMTWYERRVRRRHTRSG
jgi:NhaP-type Na+/H+ or K+/H+ antiporter